jgi:antitoxin CptB
MTSQFLSGAITYERSDIRCRRLLFRCWHRGTQEGDLILGAFAESSLSDLNSTQLDQFEALLHCSDTDVFGWIAGNSVPPPEHDHDLMRLMRDFWARRRRKIAQGNPQI